MLKKILIIIAVAIVAFVIIVALQPSEFRIERSAVISAAPSTVFPLINDFRKWEGWSPWAKLDPNMKQTYEGAEAGTGAVYWWSGNDDVGEGRMTITESRPDEYIRITLEFIKPFPSTNTTEFTLTPQGDRTAVQWNMYAENNFMAKAFGLFVNVDELVGADFEKGLSQMKFVAESPETL